MEGMIRGLILLTMMLVRFLSSDTSVASCLRTLCRLGDRIRLTRFVLCGSCSESMM